MSNIMKKNVINARLLFFLEVSQRERERERERERQGELNWKARSTSNF